MPTDRPHDSNRSASPAPATGPSDAAKAREEPALNSEDSIAQDPGTDNRWQMEPLTQAPGAAKAGPGGGAAGAPNGESPPPDRPHR